MVCRWLLFETLLDLTSLVSLELRQFVSDMSSTASGRSSLNSSALTGFDGLQRCL